MALPLMTTDVANHSKLDDFPSNDFGSTSLLKAYYDKAAVDIKAYINSVLIPAVEVYSATGLAVGGEYSAEATYSANTIISYEGSAYITIQEVTGATPTNDGVNYWLLVEKGDTPVGYSYEDLADVPTTFEPSAHNQAETTITFTDITTGNASSTKHGYLPKLPNNTTTFLRGDGTYSTVSVSSLYEKIRSIADANAASTVSIDLSDIDFSVWREIRLIGEVSSSVSDSITFRVNSQSSGYTSTIVSTASASLVASTARIFLLTGTGSSANIAHFDFSIFKNVADITGLLFKINQVFDNDYAGTGVCKSTQTSLSAINFVGASGTTYIQNVELWGIRR